MDIRIGIGIFKVCDLRFLFSSDLTVVSDFMNFRLALYRLIIMKEFHVFSKLTMLGILIALPLPIFHNHCCPTIYALHISCDLL